jgi:ATP-dependent exoDNAse (exonuclease V) alpha subunit
MRHFDHGYAVTSHVSQGLTESRVLANIDTEAPRALINSRLSYVALSRGALDARIYTNDAEALGTRLATDVSKTSAVDFRRATQPSPTDKSQAQVYEYADSNHRLAAVALAYAERPSTTVVIAKDPAERQELNQLIRADLQARGMVAPDSISLPVRIEQDLPNRRSAAQYALGDIVRYKQGSPSLEGIPHNSEAIVVSTNTKSNQLTVRTSHGEEITYSPHLTTAMTAESKVYRQEQQEFALGDRIRLTEATAKQRIRQEDFGTITALSEPDRMEVRLDKGPTVALNKEQARHIEHGYAVDSLKTGAPERILITQQGQFQDTPEIASLSRTGREVSVYASDGSIQGAGQKNAQTPTVALPDQLKPSIVTPEQQRQEAPAQAIAPESAPVVQHRHLPGAQKMR